MPIVLPQHFLSLNHEQNSSSGYICSNCHSVHKFLVICGACGWSGCEHCAIDEGKNYSCPKCGNNLPKRR